MTIFQNLFKNKNKKYKIYRKKFKGGYSLEFSQMIINFNLFLKSAPKDFDVNNSNYYTHPDWKIFFKYLSECLKFHFDNAGCTTIKMCFDLEKMSTSKIWDDFSEEDKSKMEILAKRLDKEYRFKIKE